MLNTLINYIKSFRNRTALQNKIRSIAGIKPVNIDLYKFALTHKSIGRHPSDFPGHNNERLEYLGDAILSAVIADYLFTFYPNYNEGFLTQMRSKLVSRENLNKIALKMGIDKLIMLNKHVIPAQKHIFGNALEAIIGAIYLDKGYRKTRKFIIKKIIRNQPDLDKIAYEERDFKSQIIQWGQKNKQEISFKSHEIIQKDKPQPAFVATIHIMDMLAGEGLGTTKKEAQQHAARQALKNLPS